MKNWPLTKLQALSLANTLPHAWLFVTRNLNETLKNTEEFAQWLLCLNPRSEFSCGACKSCHLFAARTHPDLYIVSPPADKNTISIDEIRSATTYVSSKPQLSRYKVILIYPVEAVLKQATNALLKSLEEPSGDTIFLMLTKHQQLLLKTLVSRCQVVQINDQHATVTAQDITKQITQDLTKLWITKTLTVTQIVDVWVKRWPDEVLYCLEIVITDLIRFKYTQDRDLALDWNEEQILLSKVLTSSKIWSILDRLRVTQYWLGHNQKPNLQLVLEDMLVV